MNILTFNLRVDLPQDGENAWRFRSQKAAEVIKSHKPAVFGTQEGKRHMLKDLERDLGDYGWLGGDRRGGNEDEFCALFYQRERVEAVDHGQFWLSETPEVPGSISWESDYPRICTWAVFQLNENRDKKFIVYNTHLDHISQKARENGIHLIGEKIKEHQEKTNLPIILMGDLNSELENEVVRFLRGQIPLNGSTIKLKDAFEKLEEAPGRTFHGFQGGLDGAPIDYIFTTLDIVVKDTKIDRSRAEEGYPSDHYPVIAAVEIMHD
ncbi:endonuclease/exonuclease/phosphatase family protein [Jeotgalibacillus sp. S-D1]|uniref:endonuclease/exonuclease/phosphatase family protein n=1 Tax=Jeotgalibacillus sp. S-D1 TaxID=2552189 RepID=UPI00105A2F38|nr:endonuclease/exonuclease/phosphatase family protein [Jeotgalibacillus sp. S-D1]TDL32868.1 endonuclease/exonuclease/phosphatase family protein [Jeotgalibacillus sp. S-D1]